MSFFDAAARLAEFDDIAAKVADADPREIRPFAVAQKPQRRIFPYLYLPVEVAARELRPKALIAQQAKKAGFTVILGASWAFPAWIAHLPPGIALMKSCNALDAQNIQRWVAAGSLTAVLDEEVFGVNPTPEHLKGTFNQDVAALADLVCAQGASYARAFPYPINVKVTGQPRTLTYRQVSGGRDILVSSISGTINPKGQSFADVVGMVLSMAPANLRSDPGKAWVKLMRNSIAHQCHWTPILQDAIRTLAMALPDRRIVVRPHPIEDRAGWHFDFPNVVLDQSPDIATALSQTSVLVFASSCTTGMDAHFCGIPAVRIGSGGHGISAGMYAEAAPADIVAAVKGARLWDGDLGDYAAPVTVVPTLREMYEAHKAEGSAEITLRPKVEPTDFHRHKFPDMTAEQISQLVGYPATQVTWNTWII